MVRVNSDAVLKEPEFDMKVKPYAVGLKDGDVLKWILHSYSKDFHTHRRDMWIRIKTDFSSFNSLFDLENKNFRKKVSSKLATFYDRFVEKYDSLICDKAYRGDVFVARYAKFLAKLTYSTLDYDPFDTEESDTAMCDLYKLGKQEYLLSDFEGASSDLMLAIVAQKISQHALNPLYTSFMVTPFVETSAGNFADFYSTVIVNHTRTGESYAFEMTGKPHEGIPSILKLDKTVNLGTIDSLLDKGFSGRDIFDNRTEYSFSFPDV